MTWNAVLGGALRDQAVHACGAVADELSRLTGPAELVPRYTEESDASLGSGTAGVAVTLAFLAGPRSTPRARARALELLETSTEAMASTEMDASLHGGYTGIAWSFSRVAGLSESADDEDELSEIDQELLSLLSQSPWGQDYDLISGLAGFGVYALERLPRPSARKCLERIVDRLAETAECAGSARTWHTSPSLLTDYQRKSSPAGFYNLGLAHGVPGVIGLLGQVCAAGVAERKARSLLDGAVEWLLAQRQEGASAFPYWTGCGTETGQSRSAWCYGDPGVAAALLLAARCVGDPAWEREAVELALRAARRPLEECGVIDVGLCHGAAGLGHIFNRMFQRTGHQELGTAAVAWFGKALSMRVPGAGLAGFTTAVKNLESQITFERDPSFLTGAAGVALALAAAADPVEPTWDRVLMLSSPSEP